MLFSDRTSLFTYLFLRSFDFKLVDIGQMMKTEYWKWFDLFWFDLFFRYIWIFGLLFINLELKIYRMYIVQYIYASPFSDITFQKGSRCWFVSSPDLSGAGNENYVFGIASHLNQFIRPFNESDCTNQFFLYQLFA